MVSSPIISWPIHGEKVETVTDLIFFGSKITADGDYSHEIKRRLLLRRKSMTNLDSILKVRDITLLSWWIIGSCSLSQHPFFLFIQRCLLDVLSWVISSPFISEKLCTSRCVGKTIFPSLIRLYFVGQAVLSVGTIYYWVLLLFFVDRSWAFSGPLEYGQIPLKLYMGFHWQYALWVMTFIIIWIICLISGIVHARRVAGQPV